MVGSNKILTVSYGTFSCTLEGFDQPFNTMQQIAEYFRDLAADDRYFGAEPPQPDAEMLQRIAQREVTRQVESHVDPSGVTLRQVEAGRPVPRREGPRRPEAKAAPKHTRQPAPEPVAEEVSPADDSVAAKLARIRAVVARARAERDAVTYEEDEPTEAGFMDDSLDEALAGTEVGSTEAPAGNFEDEVSPDDESESRITALESMDEAPETADGPETGADAADSAATETPFPSPEALAVAATIAEAAPEAASDDADAPETAEDGATGGDEIFADETGIAEAMSLEQDLEPEAGAPQADETAVEIAGSTETGAEVEVTEGEALAGDAAEADDADRAGPSWTEWTETAPRVWDSAQDDAAGHEPAEATAEVPDVAGESEGAEAEARETPGGSGAVLEDDEEDALDAALFESAERFAADRDAADDGSAGDATGAEEDFIEIDAIDEDGDDRPQARVIKLKRSDFEAALAAGELEEIEDEDAGQDATGADETGATAEAPAGAPADDLTGDDQADGDEADTTGSGAVFAELAGAQLDDQGYEDEDEGTAEEAGEDTLTSGIRDLIGDTSLDDDDEAELLQELAEVEREAAEAAHREAQAAGSQHDEDAEHDAEAEPVEHGGEEQAFNRLLQETDAQFGDTEGSRRRSAIAHLKAAVAATKADLLLKTSRSKQKDKRIEQYREDLDQVVRPRRPAAVEGRETGRRPEDPMTSRPAPLMLLSDYRVDADPASEAAGAVRPRRVRAPEQALDADTAARNRAMAEAGSFSDFATRVGATDLPDILEAAAAYAAFVEGQEQVTRPQLLRRAAMVTPGAEITREQGLKSFGQLLRSGRIRKLGHGRFAVSESTRFAEQARASGE